MSSHDLSHLLAFLRRLAIARPQNVLTDGELLQRFAVQREEAAFAALMQRHGPMVLGVCQSLLQDPADAEDVFQATFVVLVRKARAIGKPASVASWLHGVAYRLSMRLRSEAARRRAGEGKAVPMTSCSPPDEADWRDLRPLLHEEVARLPDRYRLPFVLCYLEGKTNEEAAELLGWPKGTVQSRLSRGREKLRTRLTRRGLAPTGAFLAALFSQDAARSVVSAALAEATLKAVMHLSACTSVAGAVAARAIYAEGLQDTPGREKLASAVVIAILLGMTGIGAGAWMSGATQSTQASLSVAPPAAEPRKPLPPPAGTKQQAVRQPLQVLNNWINTAMTRDRRRDLANNGWQVACGVGHFGLKMVYRSPQEESYFVTLSFHCPLLRSFLVTEKEELRAFPSPAAMIAVHWSRAEGGLGSRKELFFKE
jgi:RNA polymerase sigma factor (sigma-70 family)